MQHHLLLIPVQFIGVVLLADFLAGVVHWLEDAYGTAETPVVGPLLIRPNIVHHHFPRFFTRLTWWQSSWDLALLAGGLLAAAWALDLLCWQVWVFAVVSVNANQVHKWSHRTRAENGPLISFLQDVRVLQTPRHHALHHTDPRNTFYCPVTNLVNPVLEWCRFWDRLERLVERVSGVRHRLDTANRGCGPGPAWLAEYRPAPVVPGGTCSRAAAGCRTACGGRCGRRETPA
jgi:ubiquitin-conjugating enzyme E2 variant